MAKEKQGTEETNWCVSLLTDSFPSEAQGVQSPRIQGDAKKWFLLFLFSWFLGQCGKKSKREGKTENSKLGKSVLEMGSIPTVKGPTRRNQNALSERHHFPHHGAPAWSQNQTEPSLDLSYY